MISIDFKRNTVSYRQLWGNESPDLSAIEKSGIDILDIRESYVLLPGLYPFRNGVVDLSAGTAAAYEKFEKGFKYEVRRAEKDGFVCRELDDISDAVLKAYYTFSANKKIASIDNEFISIYRQRKALFTSCAYLNETPLRYHLYFVMDKEIILLASFPALDIDDVKKTAIGFANRYLHWFDIQHAASIGKNVYNLGGMGNNEDVTDTQSIAKFKMEMAPADVNYYHGLIPVSFKGRLYLALKKLLNKNA